MVELYQLLSTYEGLIYLVLLLGGVFAARSLWVAWRASRDAIYSLERDMAQRRLRRAVAVAVLLAGLLFSEFVVASFVVPALPPSYFLSTPTLDLLKTPTGTISAELAATLAALPQIAAETISDGCVPKKIMITSPAPGENISGLVDLIGTVDIPNLGFYKFEIAPRDTENWATVFAGRDTKRNGELGRLDTGELTPGDYQLRLVVTDNQGTLLPPCVIPLQVVGE